MELGKARRRRGWPQSETDVGQEYFVWVEVIDSSYTTGWLEFETLVARRGDCDEGGVTGVATWYGRGV
jgi:hypothetical protein